MRGTRLPLGSRTRCSLPDADSGTPRGVRPQTCGCEDSHLRRVARGGQSDRGGGPAARAASAASTSLRLCTGCPFRRAPNCTFATVPEMGDSERVDRLTYVGHATVLLELGGRRLLTDPLLRARVGPPAAPRPGAGRRRARARRRPDLPPAPDHLDLPSLRTLDRRRRADRARAARALLAPEGLRRASTRCARATRSAARRRRACAPCTPSTTAAGRPLGGAEADTLGFVFEAAGGASTSRATPTCSTGWRTDRRDRPGAAARLGLGADARHRATWTRARPPRPPPLEPRLAVPIHWGTFFPVGLSRLPPAG